MSTLHQAGNGDTPFPPSGANALGTVKSPNLDPDTVAGFGDEWQRFDQLEMDVLEQNAQFQRYFSIFPWERLSNRAVGFDMGCGSGRWARHVAPRVHKLYCVDASESALAVARRTLADHPNCAFVHASVDLTGLAVESMDFGYSLGVLHHLPDPAEAMRSCVQLLKPGAPLLLYVYYAFDNRPWWFRLIWKASDLVRLTVSRLPFTLRYWISQIIAALVYFPLIRLSSGLERCGIRVDSVPLSAYRGMSFYTMRTDALDRFGTRLEKRFTAREIEALMSSAGLVDIRISDTAPFWCAVGIKRGDGP